MASYTNGVIGGFISNNKYLLLISLILSLIQLFKLLLFFLNIYIFKLLLGSSFSHSKLYNF